MIETNKRLFSHISQQRISFIGREVELAEIKRLLVDDSCQLLTLLGPGGAGKTRLAVVAAENVSSEMSVCFVPLQSVGTPSAVLPAIADTLDLTLAVDVPPVTQLTHFLKEKKALLILDNLEHVLDCADDLSALLAELPRLKLLITSREVLNLQEEWLFPIAGLSIPQRADTEDLTKFGSVSLFCDRAQQVRPDFSLMAEAESVVKICRLTGGLPLALELAAAWLKMMTCAAIAQEIETNLDFLSSRLRNVPERHRSMQAVFNQTWQMLSADEQQIYTLLSLFRSGFRREAAAKITGANLDMLTRLVEKSLLVREANGRYQIHELLRQFAAAEAAAYPDLLAEARHRYADYYTEFLYQRTDHMLGAHQQEAAAEIAADLDNIRAAWEWAINHEQIDFVDKAVDALDMYCQVQSKFLEGKRLFSQISSHTAFKVPEAQPLLARVVNNLGWFHIRLGQFDAAEKAFAQSQSLYQQHKMAPPMGHSTDPQLGFAALAAIRGQYDMADALAKAALTLADEQQNKWNEAVANYLLAGTAQAQGAYKQAQQFASAACAAAETTEDQWFLAYCLYEMGQTALTLGDYTHARQHLTACYDLRQAFADPEGMALAINSLGEIAYRQGQLDEAQSFFERSLSMYHQINDPGGLAAAHHGLGRTAVAQQEYDIARQQFHHALQITDDIQFVTFQLEVLADVADFLLRTGRIQQGLSLLHLVQADPAANQAVKRRVEQQLAHYRTAVSPTLYNTAQPPSTTFDATQMALAELLVPAEAVESPLPNLSPTNDLVEPLTDRELEVLHHIAQGYTNKQIADRLSIVVGTVKAHNNRLFGKLEVSNRAQAIARARELGLVS